MAKTIVQFQGHSSRTTYDGRVTHQNLYASIDRNVHGLWMTVRSGDSGGKILFTCTLKEWAAAMDQFDKAVIEAASTTLSGFGKNQASQSSVVGMSP